MNLTLWKHRNPINGELSRIREEMDRTIERMFGGSVVESKMLRNEGWLPAIDVSENDTEVTVRAEVPGIAPVTAAHDRRASRQLVRSLV